jgi:branched-chain amino acid transport system ATP-binding protein
VTLELRNVRVRYPNGALGILDVSLTVEDGQTVALFGPNGAGKSTTTRAISGFLPTEGARVIGGQITLSGKRLNGAEPNRVTRLGVAIVPERNKVFANLTVSENLAALGVVPPRARRKELMDQIYGLFPVLEKRRHQAAGRLSGGERQMLAIGRALLLDPSVLIIDEMTLGLHYSLQPALYKAVQSVAAAGTAVLIVDESNAFAIEVADYCYRISEGRIVEDGLPGKFRAHPADFAETHGVVE